MTVKSGGRCRELCGRRLDEERCSGVGLGLHYQAAGTTATWRCFSWAPAYTVWTMTTGEWHVAELWWLMMLEAVPCMTE
jgi:hypothetical protein